jgi:hypothetical protein
MRSTGVRLSKVSVLAERQLSDDWFYSKSEKDPTKQFSDEITNELTDMYDYGYIDEKPSVRNIIWFYVFYE